jgi:hypothetical protein
MVAHGFRNPPKAFAVGTLIAERPRTDPDLPNSGIRLLPTVFDEKSLFRPWVSDTRFRQILLDDHIHAPPCQPPSLAPSPEAPVPTDFGVMTDRANGPDVGWHGEVGVVPLQHAGQSVTLVVDWFVPHAP